VITAAQIVPNDITVTGFTFLFTSTIFNLPVGSPTIQVALYSGPPGVAASPVPGVTCSILLPIPMFIGNTSNCSGTATATLQAGNSAFLLASSTASDATTYTGQISTGLTTN
jgi:hypothetical protein